MDLMIEDLSLHESQYLGYGCFHNPIDDWLEESYLTSSISTNKLQYYLELNMYRCMIEICFQVIHIHHPYNCGKLACWIERAFKEHLYADNLDLLSYVQIIYVSIFIFLHCFIWILIIHIFHFTG